MPAAWIAAWAAVAGGIDFTAPEVVTLPARTGPLRPGERALEPLASAPLIHTSHGVVLDVSMSGLLEQQALLTWLTADARTFWVNLNPNEPERVIDAELARTAVGRTLLEADLRMKIDIARLLHPDSEAGALFWSELYSLIDVRAKKLCLSFRTWLVPQHATVVEAPHRVALVNGSLGVLLESEYIGRRASAGGAHGAQGGGDEETEGADAASAVFAGCDVEARRDGELAASLYRQLLLPALERHINTDGAYAALRAQLHHRLLAEWLRAKNGSWRAAYAELVAEGGSGPSHVLRVATATAGGELHAVLRAPNDDGFSPRATFERYARSFSAGEFNVTRYVQRGEFAYAKVFFYGAIDFRMGATAASADAPSAWLGARAERSGAGGRSDWNGCQWTVEAKVKDNG